MKICLTLIGWMLFYSCLFANDRINVAFSDAFLNLKTELSNRDYYLEKKLVEIERIEGDLKNSKDNLNRFEVLKKLYGKYFDLKIDTALVYAKQMLVLSEKISTESLRYRIESLLLVVRAYTYIGKYKESEELLKSKELLSGSIPNELKSLYFLVRLELNKNLADHVILEDDIDLYRNRIKNNLDSLIAYTPQNSVRHAIYLSNRLKADKNYEEAFKVLENWYKKLTTNDRDMAHIVYYMGDLAAKMGKYEEEKFFLAISATTDVKYSVKEYVSLWYLANILYKEGDIETAYRFIEISLQDAQYSGAYRWIQQIKKIIPDIYASYNAKVIKQRNQMLLFLFIISGLSIGIFFHYRRLKKAKIKLNSINDDLILANNELNKLSVNLNLSNADLQLANSQLLFLNHELTSASLLKETSLSKYIDLCSDYIDKLDDYRVSLKRLLKGGRIDKIQSELDSTKYIEKEYKAFLLNFDETFLKLYPDFVNDYNDLFPIVERLVLKKNEMLNTELRIYALILLGIEDSNKIARFLRCSITTIYTYRSKIKSKSLYPDSFDDRIKNLQGHQHLLV